MVVAGGVDSAYLGCNPPVNVPCPVFQIPLPRSLCPIPLRGHLPSKTLHVEGYIPALHYIFGKIYRETVCVIELKYRLSRDDLFSPCPKPCDLLFEKHKAVVKGLGEPLFLVLNDPGYIIPLSCKLRV